MFAMSHVLFLPLSLLNSAQSCNLLKTFPNENSVLRLRNKIIPVKCRERFSINYIDRKRVSWDLVGKLEGKAAILLIMTFVYRSTCYF
jgi:hypothetical protein